MACGAYHHAIIISPCVYARHLFAENVATDTTFWKYEDAARHLATQLMSKYSNLAVLGYQTSGRVPSDVWSDPNRLNAYFFSQASRIILLVPSDAEEHVNSFSRTCLAPLLTCPKEEGGRPEWHSRFVAAVIGNTRVPNQLAPGVPFIDVVRFREIGWVRDVTGMMLLQRAIKDFWVPSQSITDDQLSYPPWKTQSTQFEGYSLCETIETSFWLGTSTHVTGQIDINELDNAFSKGIDSPYPNGRAIRSRSGRRSKSRSQSRSRHTSSSGYRSLEPEFEAEQIDERLLDTRITHIVQATKPVVLTELVTKDLIVNGSVCPQPDVINESNGIPSSPDNATSQLMAELDSEQTDSQLSTNGTVKTEVTVVRKVAVDEQDSAQITHSAAAQPHSPATVLDAAGPCDWLPFESMDGSKEGTGSAVSSKDITIGSEEKEPKDQSESTALLRTQNLSEKVTQASIPSPRIPLTVEDGMSYQATDSAPLSHPSETIHSALKVQSEAEKSLTAKVTEVNKSLSVDGTDNTLPDESIPFIDSGTEEEQIIEPSAWKTVEHTQPRELESLSIPLSSEQNRSEPTKTASYWSVTRTKPPESPIFRKQIIWPKLSEPLNVEVPVELNEAIHLTPPRATVETSPRFTPFPSSERSQKSYITVERLTSGSTRTTPQTRNIETDPTLTAGFPSRKATPVKSVHSTAFHEDEADEQSVRKRTQSAGPKGASYMKKTITREEFFTESVKIERRTRPNGTMDSADSTVSMRSSPNRSNQRVEKDSRESVSEEIRSHSVRLVSPGRQTPSAEGTTSESQSSPCGPQQSKTERNSNRIFYVRSSKPSMGDSTDLTTSEEAERARSVEPQKTFTTPILRSAGHSLPPSPHLARRQIVKLYPSPWLYPPEGTVADAYSQIRAPLASGYMTGEGISCYAFSGTRYRKNKLEIPKLFLCKDAAVWTGPDSAETFRFELLHALPAESSHPEQECKLITPKRTKPEQEEAVCEKSVKFQQAVPKLPETRIDKKRAVVWKISGTYIVSCLVAFLSVIVMFFWLYHKSGASLEAEFYSFWSSWTSKFMSKRSQQD
ncbi:serine-rich repeat protein [Clonorchis sinensis]|uniref:Serine-rich repeat protein n=1 Tax=Clonorchis sinensis TaxID=79923 RepID=G7YRD3_CLOSI|nr:serine-rich repeat protein [Clonorchis sinensis]